MPRMEDAEWNPPVPKLGSESTFLLRSLKVGEVKRIVHDDLKCILSPTGNVKSCSLLDRIKHLRDRKWWGIEYYHEAPHILVVRRLKNRKETDEN